MGYRPAGDTSCAAAWSARTEEDGGRQRRARDGLLLVGAAPHRARPPDSRGDALGPRPPLRLWPRGPRARRGRRRHRRRARGWRAQGHADLVGRLHALGHGSGWQHLRRTGGDQVPGTTPSPASGGAGSAEAATAAGMSLSFLVRQMRPPPPPRRRALGGPLPTAGLGAGARGMPATRSQPRVPARSGRALAASHRSGCRRRPRGHGPGGAVTARTRRGDWPRLGPAAPGPRPGPRPRPAGSRSAGRAATVAAAGRRGLREADGRGAPGAGARTGRQGGERSRIPSALRAGNFG